jgi:acid phosphatase family membrane protein YuiD
MSLPIALIAAVTTQVLCQLYKVVFYSTKDGVFSFKYFFTSGGMPSAHSAFVTALATSVALSSGVFSDLFAVCAVFGFIVIYDAYRLRGTVEKLTIIIRRLIEKQTRGPHDRPSREGAAGQKSPDMERILAARAADPIERIKLPNMLGHTVPEIAVGIAVGLILGGVISLPLLHFVG